MQKLFYQTCQTDLSLTGLTCNTAGEGSHKTELNILVISSIEWQIQTCSYSAEGKQCIIFGKLTVCLICIDIIFLRDLILSWQQRTVFVQVSGSRRSCSSRFSGHCSYDTQEHSLHKYFILFLLLM